MMATREAHALAEGADEVVASVEIAATPARVFRAVTSAEIVRWWINPGVHETHAWSGEPRVGGLWHATGTVRGQPFALEGEYLEVEPPHRLVHTWRRVDTADPPSTVTYLLEPIGRGTRLTIRHDGLLRSRAATTGAGWKTSLTQLVALLGRDANPQRMTSGRSRR